MLLDSQYVSLNDILNEDFFHKSLPVIAILIIAIMALCWFLVAKKVNKDIYGDGRSVRERAHDVLVVQKRSVPHPMSKSAVINYVLFETNDGKRIEFAVKESDNFGMIAVGDIGTLEYAGKMFLGFYRKR
ncbi:MAG: DUF2500 domain-containing protein [Ruminococcaceae bacterium]|nr:DUF2500 domain-containing protein [Oscillospiraceae bacterium]